MPEVSTPKWHLGHTTWFFENFVLAPLIRNYQPFHTSFRYLFNSSLEGFGEYLDRSRRGLLSRPGIEEIYRYRSFVNSKLIETLSNAKFSEVENVISSLILGIHHEQQHQELLLTDILHIFWSNPLRPVYQTNHIPLLTQTHASGARWIEYSGGIKAMGYKGDSFSFDHERPQHRIYLENFKIQSRLVTNGEYLDFIESKGYQNPSLWLSDGWRFVQEQKWNGGI
jgi:ergothioneine biosynthesis protein EgtB